MLAAPLIAGNDLRIYEWTKTLALLSNSDVIAVWSKTRLVLQGFIYADDFAVKAYKGYGFKTALKIGDWGHGAYLIEVTQGSLFYFWWPTAHGKWMLYLNVQIQKSPSLYEIKNLWMAKYLLKPGNTATDYPNLTTTLFAAFKFKKNKGSLKGKSLVFCSLTLPKGTTVIKSNSFIVLGLIKTA